LLAPLVQLLQCLVSCVFFFHDLNMGAITRNSRLQWAESIACSGVVDTTTVHSALPGWQGTDANEQWVLEVTGRVVARSDRFRFTVPYQGLECIPCAGTVIGDNAGEPVTTPYDDCILVMPSTRQARAGVTVVRFARRSRLT
jgi:hypothetical protein